MLIPRSHAISLIDRQPFSNPRRQRIPGESNPVDASGSLTPWATFFPFFFFFAQPQTPSNVQSIYRRPPG
ncbi:hypothetical protein K443DRAFT_203630 [Laccaria amethystina LaAM-08-1]|uniref:Uncharacterized protein n=1 Tax=Laccaria amethystina LaAM-08-1 TaxID=1095629 RepID=A0A0C9X563_9AGAR|nr:hypothetical protein K443DRAFT_203630 [Laccaria amethystina LaAM-08-1]